jgi:hypothetical protein
MQPERTQPKENIMTIPHPAIVIDAEMRRRIEHADAEMRRRIEHARRGVEISHSLGVLMAEHMKDGETLRELHARLLVEAPCVADRLAVIVHDLVAYDDADPFGFAS